MGPPAPENGRILDALSATPTDLAELHSAAAKVAFGLFLFLPNTTFTWPAPLLAPAWLWATTLLAVGTLHGGAVIINRGRRVRTGCACLGALLWCGLFALTGAWHPVQTVGIVFFPIQAVVCAWVWLRRTRALGPTI